MLFSSLACADYYWTCPTPNGYWDVSANWFGEPDEPQWIFPGYVPTGEASNWNTVFARVQQGSAVINSDHIPNGRIQRIYLGGPSGASLTVESGTISIYRFYMGCGAGWLGTFNQTGGTINITATSPPSVDFGQGTSVYNLSGGTFSNVNNTYMPYSENVTVPIDCNFTMNISNGGIFRANGGRVYLGYVPDSVGRFNLSSGQIISNGRVFAFGINGGKGYLNQTGGDFIFTGINGTTDKLQIGSSGGYGEISISGGTFESRFPVIIDNGIFKVSGTGATNIAAMGRMGVGPCFRFWNGINETLAYELDSSGVTPIQLTNFSADGNAVLTNGTMTINTLGGFNGTAGTVYPLMYASAATNSITASDLKLVVLTPNYDFEYYIENDAVKGQWLKLRQLNASICNSGNGFWSSSGTWQNGAPSISKSAVINGGTVSLPTDGSQCEAKKLRIGGIGLPVLNIDNNSKLNLQQLVAGGAPSQTAQINISGGNVKVNGDVMMALSPGANVIINQTAGDVNITGDLNMGWNTTTTGAAANVNYTISGGKFVQHGEVFRLGYCNSQGNFTQTGGQVVFDVNVKSSCRLGYSDGSAQYSISGGSLTAPTNFVIDSASFEVLGSNIASISFDRFRVTDKGTFLVGLDSDITPVVATDGNATFENGSKIVVRLLNGFATGSTYDIVNAKDIIDEGLSVISEDANYTFGSQIVNDDFGRKTLRIAVGYSNATAHSPLPANGVKACYQDAQTLQWTNPRPSEPTGSVSCDVYIADAAIDPGFTNPVKIVNKQPVEFATTTLNPLKSYLWRVDVYDNSYGAENKVTGNVWSFTTAQAAIKSLEWNFENTSDGAAYQKAINGDDIIVTAHGAYSIDTASNTVNGWGLDGLKHWQAPATGYGMWRSIPVWDWPGVAAPGSTQFGIAWIKYDFEQAYNLGTMWIWNHNGVGTGGPSDIEGVEEAYIEYSADGVTYNTLGTTHMFGEASHGPDYAHNTEINFNGISAKSVIITPISNFGASYVGLSEVRFGINNTTATETVIPDSAGSCTAKASGNCIVETSGIYASEKCIGFNGGFDYLYSNSTNANVPIDGNLPWSMNCYVYLDRQPAGGTLIAGFGDLNVATEGYQRFICAQADAYIGFWGQGSASDITCSDKFDLRKWQMISATFDANTVRIYKNGKLIGSRNVKFANSAAKVRVVPRTGRATQPVGVTRGPVAFFGKIDDVTMYNGVLSETEMKQLAARLPMGEDLNADGVINTKDLKCIAENWLKSAPSAQDVDASGLVKWTEDFEDGTGFQSRWTTFSGDWTGKVIVADAHAPQGGSVLSLIVPTNYMERSIGTMNDVFEISWYYSADGANGAGDSRIQIVDAEGLSLAVIHHTTDNAMGVIYANTGTKVYSFAPNDNYIKVTLRIDQEKGKCALLINDSLLESGFALSNGNAGSAAAIRVQKTVEQNPISYFDAIKVDESVLSVEYPVCDFKVDGIVNFEDFAVLAEEWLRTF